MLLMYGTYPGAGLVSGLRFRGMLSVPLKNSSSDRLFINCVFGGKYPSS